jgi:beta-lactamase class D
MGLGLPQLDREIWCRKARPGVPERPAKVMEGTMNERRRLHAVTRRAALGLSAGGVAAMTYPGLMSASAHVRDYIRFDLKAVFADNGVAGTFVLYDPEKDTIVEQAPRFTVVGDRPGTRFVPASTFKIPNSIVALETGVVTDENEIIPYGGKPQPFKQWEKDMSMREAIALSAVPIYQELARRIGLPRYRQWLPRLDFGNGETGAAVDRFWLDGPLEVSAMEEARFVARLAQGKLEASARSQAIVRDIIRLESHDGRVLYGKTGWCASSNPNIGWWTGWVEDGSKVTAFSLNIDMPAGVSDAPKRVAIGKTLLGRLGVF